MDIFNDNDYKQMYSLLDQEIDSLQEDLLEAEKEKEVVYNDFIARVSQSVNNLSVVGPDYISNILNLYMKEKSVVQLKNLHQKEIKNYEAKLIELKDKFLDLQKDILA